LGLTADVVVTPVIEQVRSCFGPCVLGVCCSSRRWDDVHVQARCGFFYARVRMCIRGWTICTQSDCPVHGHLGALLLFVIIRHQPTNQPFSQTPMHAHARACKHTHIQI
jgi:hypothetical protein